MYDLVAPTVPMLLSFPLFFEFIETLHLYNCVFTINIHRKTSIIKTKQQHLHRIFECNIHHETICTKLITRIKSNLDR